MEKDYFLCFSRKLMFFLKYHDLAYEYKSKHENGRIYYAFKEDEKLHKALIEWKNSRPVD